MKIVKFLGAAPALFFLLCAVAWSDYEPVQRFDFPGNNKGRPLTPAETATLDSAINNIGRPPPATVTYRDDQGNTKTANCSTIAADLRKQLRDSGRVQAETSRTGRGAFWTLPDTQKSTGGDKMNIDPEAVAKAGTSAAWMRVVEGCLVHEWDHKTQDSAALADTIRREIEPYSIMAAYFCSTTTDCADNPRTWALNEEARRRPPPPPPPPPPGTGVTRSQNISVVHDHLTYFHYGPWPLGVDSLISLDPAGPGRFAFPLGPFRGSDLITYPVHPMLPPGHALAVICGGLPDIGNARIAGFDLFHGEVIGMPIVHEFGPPLHPPMYFNSMMPNAPAGEWYVLDFLNHQILRMQDLVFADGVPDEIAGVFASLAVPGFEPLLNAVGIDFAIHPFMGPGVLLVNYDIHIGEMHAPYDHFWFLMDADGDMQADVIAPTRLCEFLQVYPSIVGPQPWISEMHVQLFATWEHDIAVWSTDESGEILQEMLGMQHMARGMHAECMLLRPLMPHDRLVAVDMQTGQRSGPPVPVVAAMPEALVLHFDPDGILYMQWAPFPGAANYAIYASNDGVEFYDTGLRTTAPSFELPLPPIPRQYYHVTALR